MNNPSLICFQNQVQSGGTIFLNSSMIEARPIRGDLEIYEVPASDLAKQLGQDKVTNMVYARSLDQEVWNGLCRDTRARSKRYVLQPKSWDRETDKSARRWATTICSNRRGHVKQIIVTLDNVPGKLSEVSDYLGENGFNIIALSVVDTADVKCRSGSFPIIRTKRSMS